VGGGLMVSLSVLGILCFIGLLYLSLVTINEHYGSKINYKPFNIDNFIIIAIPCFISIILLALIDDWVNHTKINIDYKDLNHIVLYIFVTIACAIVCMLIYSKTRSIVIAVYSTVLIFIGAVFVALIIILVIGYIVGKFIKSDEKKR
jgi:hypothetical protein